jgi:FixJ family two-component response regulator
MRNHKEKGRHTEDSGYRQPLSGRHISSMAMVTSSRQTAEPPQTREPRIYVFDRDDDVRDSLKMLLESNRMAVKAFGSATELLGEAVEHPGDCLILGFNRLIVEGLDLVAALRRRQVKTPIIFIDGGGDALTRASALNAGADAYLERPIPEARLLRTIMDALPRSKATEAVQ